MCALACLSCLSMFNVHPWCLPKCLAYRCSSFKFMDVNIHVNGHVAQVPALHYFFSLHDNPQFLPSFHFLLGDMSGSPGPSNNPLDPVPQSAGTNAAPDSSRPVDSQSTPNILYFFTEVKFPTAANDKEKLQRVCKLCMCVWTF